MKALVVGGNGALGRAVVSALTQASWNVSNLDMTHNSEASHNIITESGELQDQIERIHSDIESHAPFNSIICTAGGWAGGSVRDKNVAEVVQSMHERCTLSALLTGHLASHYLNEDGLLVFTGAAAIYKQPQPSMIAYSVAKKATHAIALNMSMREDIPKSSTVVTIMPDTLDTPANREAMPDADFKTWAKVD
jgi:dihydropteridine reductase